MPSSHNMSELVAVAAFGPHMFGVDLVALLDNVNQGHGMSPAKVEILA